MSMHPPPSHKELYERDGFVVVSNLIPDDQKQELYDATARVIAKTRDGSWKHRRTVGSQFPPYKDGDDAWGVQHVLHPDLGENAFIKWYCSDQLRAIARELLDCADEDLQMELFNILINPESHSFALRWHRDDVKGTATEEEESQALTITHYGIQWNTALYDDECLFVVPGSHKTVRTPDQRAHSISSDAPKNPLDMPGAIQVKLKAGDTVIYNQNILHCATYSSEAIRATLHACVGNAKGGQTRARNILQHGVNWMKEDERFKQSVQACGPQAVSMWNNTIRLGSIGGELGYSQD